MGTVTVTVTDKSGHTATDSETYSVAQPAATLFGAFPGYMSATDHSESYASRLARVTSEFGGKLGVERIYQGGLMTMPTLNGPSIVSWDFPVATGSYDALLTTIGRTTKPLWVTPWHEMDNNKLSATDYVNVFRYVAGKVHAAGNPLVKMTPIYMGFTVKGGVTTKFDQFYPGDAYVDAIGFDCYVNPGIPAFNTPEGSYSAPIQICAAHGKPLVIGETSLYPGYTDAQWTDFIGRMITALDTPNTDAAAWFETNKSDGDWRMSVHPNAVPLWAAVSSR